MGNGISGNSFDGESAANLLEVLEMNTRIFMCLSTKLVSLHHVDESRLSLKSIVSDVDRLSSRMLAVVGAENSRRVLLAMASKTGVKLRLVGLSSNSKAGTLLSLALILLINASGSSTLFVGRSKPVIHYLA